jgi:hypothetical protein
MFRLVDKKYSEHSKVGLLLENAPQLMTRATESAELIDGLIVVLSQICVSQNRGEVCLWEDLKLIS